MRNYVAYTPYLHSSFDFRNTGRRKKNGLAKQVTTTLNSVVSSFFHLFFTGISWHIVSFVRLLTDHSSKTYQEHTVYCQILNDDSLQDSTTVVALLKSALTFYKKANPGTKSFFCRSDNAAGKNHSCIGLIQTNMCSSFQLTSLKKQSRHSTHGQELSQTLWLQAGFFQSHKEASQNVILIGNLKTMVDYIFQTLSNTFLFFSCSAILKAKANASINSGMNASTAEEFAHCLSTFEGVKNCLVFCGSVTGKLSGEPEVKIQDISLCHSFDFMNDGILVKKMAGKASLSTNLCHVLNQVF